SLSVLVGFGPEPLSVLAEAIEVSAEFGRGLEVGHGSQLLEGRREGVGQRPQSSWSELFMGRLEIVPVNAMDQVPRYRKPRFHKRVVDDQLGFLISKRSFLPVSNLTAQRLEVSLNLIHADGYDINKLQPT